MNILLALPDDELRSELAAMLVAEGHEVFGPGLSGAPAAGVVICRDPAVVPPPPAPRPYVLALAPAGDPEALRRLLASGADDLLPLPLNQEALAARLAVAAVRMRPALGPAPLDVDALLFRALADSGSAALWVGRGADILWANDTLAEMLGYSNEEVLSPGFGAKVTHPEDRRVAARLGGQWLSEGGGRTRIELRLVARDGHTIWIDLGATTFDGPDGLAYVACAFDITARKLAEQSVARLGAVVEAASDAMTARDLNGKLIVWNKGAERMFGWTAEEMLGREGLQSVLPEHRESAIQDFLRVRSGGSVPIREIQRVSKDGRELTLLSSLFPVRDADGNVFAVGSCARDITEMKKTEKALRSSECRFRTLAEHAPDLIARFDRDLRFLYVNPAVERVSGVPAQRFLGRTLSEAPGVYDPAGDYSAALRAVVAEGREVTLDVSSPKGDRLYECHLVPEFDAAGRLESVLSIARDITDRQRVQQELRRREQQFKALTENSPDIVIRIDRDLRMVYANAALQRVSGVERGQLVGRRISKLAVGRRRIARWLAIMEEVFATGKSRTVDTQVRPGGVARSFEARFVPEFSSGHQVESILVIARDVTELRRATAALRESEANYRAVVEGTSDLVWIMDRDPDGTFRIVFVNSPAGIDAGDVIGKDYNDVVPPPLAERARELIDQVIAAGHSMEFEERANWPLPRLDVLTRMTPLFDKHGRCYRLVCNARDITARKQAEEARRLAEQRLQVVVRQSPVVLYALDRGGVFTMAEGSGLTSLGVGPEHLVGHHIAALYSQYPEIMEGVQRAFAGEEVRFATKVGETWFEAWMAPIRGAGGEVTGMMGVSIDITSQKRAEEARREAESWLRTVAINAPFMLYAVDKRGIITLSEGALLDFINLRPGQLVGQSALDVVAPYPAVLKDFRRALQGEAFTATHDFDTFSLETHFAPLRDDSGELQGILAVTLDVTARRRTEQALLQSQKLESLGVLAGGIAHDFNNLLVGILGNAGLALLELPPSSPVRETVAAIETAGQRAADLARQMLAYSGQGKFVIQPVDLNGLVRELTQLLRSSIHKGVEIDYRFTQGLPAVEADATQVGQLVMNLVVNASDAIGDGPGRIVVTTGLIHASRDHLDDAYLAHDLPPGDYVLLEVADTGHGMPPETLQRIFEPFFTTKFTGRGVGLAAVHGIVRGHRGAIRVESEPGRGAKFSIIFPALASAVPLALPVRTSGGWRGSGTVLIADDEPMVRAVTARALRVMGFNVLQASDGAEAVDLVAERGNELCCVLLDVTMPRLDGVDALGRIKTIRPALPVLLLSGYTEQEALARFDSSLIAGFLQKPYEIEALRTSLRRVLEGRAPAEGAA